MTSIYLFFNFSSSVKKKRTRKLSNESNSSLGNSSDSETDLNVSKTSDNGLDENFLEDLEQLSVVNNNDHEFKVIESKKKNSEEDQNNSVIASFFNDPKKFTSVKPQQSEGSKKFSKLSQRERKKLLLLQENEEKSVNSNDQQTDKKSTWNGWGFNSNSSSTNGGTSVVSPIHSSPSLATIMQSERDSNSKSTKNSSNGTISSNIPKRSRKSSWRSLSFNENDVQVMANSPPNNPWKVTPQPVVENKFSQNFHEILQEESVQSQNLTRAKSKSFQVTQLEETAIQELKTFYNVDNVFDEYLTVERVDQGIMATPIWHKNKNKTG